MIPHSKPWITDREVSAVTEVVRSGMLVGGGQIQAFEAGLRSRPNFSNARSYPSGRAAVRDGLRLLNLPAGSGVVVQTYVCDAVGWAIQQNGLRAIFCDIGDGWIATPSTVESALTSDCSAILLAPPFGFLQSAEPFRGFGLPVIHDLCQASPLVVSEASRGVLGDQIALSFDPTKYMCAAGGGVLAARAPLADPLSTTGGVPSLDEMQAALGCVQNERLLEFRSRREKLARMFLENTNSGELLCSEIDVQLGDMLRLPMQNCAGFEQVARGFALAGITVRRGVDNLAHRSVGLRDEAFPNAVRAYQTTFSVPFYPALTDSEVETIAAALERLS